MTNEANATEEFETALQVLSSELQGRDAGARRELIQDMIRRSAERSHAASNALQHAWCGLWWLADAHDFVDLFQRLSRMSLEGILAREGEKAFWLEVYASHTV